MHPTIVVAIITGVASVTVALLHLLTAINEKGNKRKNNSSSMTPPDGEEVIEQLHSLERRMDKVEVIEQLHSLERRMDRVEGRVGRLETEYVLQGWNGHEEANQKMLN